jgi:hypothetical protein
MEAAAEVDIKEGVRLVDKELTSSFESAIEKQVFGHPSLKKSLDEREPLPYRRDTVDEMEK